MSHEYFYHIQYLLSFLFEAKVFILFVIENFLNIKLNQAKVKYEKIGALFTIRLQSCRSDGKNHEKKPGAASDFCRRRVAARAKNA